jgi:uncharacterized protein (TIGR00255 family)
LIRSMTGFGEASATADGSQYFVEVRSLNSKFFKAIIRLPDDLQALEVELESVLRRRLSRGTVTMTAKATGSDEASAYAINQQALESYIEQVRKVPMVASGAVKIDVSALLALPGVVQPTADEAGRLAKARAALVPLLERACDGLIKRRAGEGDMLRADLIAQRDLIADRLGLIRQRAPGVVAEYELRLKQRIDLLLQGSGVKTDTVEVIREIAVYAERTDVAEELTRLSGHLEQFSDLISNHGDKPVGRTLDFLSQEMLREANTIASKSPDAGISRAIVEVKGAIDRIKEQVQNVE